MFCKVCNYALWNLKERTCPECGTGFAPSQFRFRPNSIRFLCPHCSQQYYGTSSTGHLVPREFDCVSCHNRIDMDRMVLVPEAGIDERQTRARGNPWLDRTGRPRIADWFRATVMSLFAPVPLIAATDDHAPPRRTLAYAVLTAAIASATSLIMPFFVLLPILAPLGINANGIEALAIYALGVLASGLLMYAIVPLYAAIAHLILLGGSPKRPFRTTLHAVALSSGGNMLWGIPLFGFMTGPAGLIWWGVSLSIMLRAVHRVRAPRAFLAGLGPPIALCLLGLIAFILMIIWSLSLASAATAAIGQPVQAQVTSVETAWTSAAATSERHVGSLILDGTLPAAIAIAPAFSQTSAVIAAGIDLSASLSTMTDEQREALAASLDASLTPDIIAYRIGDLIVIRDVPNPTPSSSLWRVAYSPEPTANPAFAQMAASTQLAIGTPVPFTSQMIGGPSNASIGPSITEQNRIRASHGLPPLPPLETILAGSPFTTTSAPATTPTDPATPENPPEGTPGHAPPDGPIPGRGG
ncbi:MAG: YIP1 family protein [Phycisphaeraceae bacterium]|nr:YIP1 family protein [Phycisphaeraceae bacterium]